VFLVIELNQFLNEDPELSKLALAESKF
jgi:hypothetical protein